MILDRLDTQAKFLAGTAVLPDAKASTAGGSSGWPPGRPGQGDTLGQVGKHR